MEAYPINKKAPYCAIMSVPPHKINEKILFCDRNSFLGYNSALVALEGVVCANLGIKGFQVLNPIHDKSLTFDRYVRKCNVQYIYLLYMIKCDVNYI